MAMDISGKLSVTLEFDGSLASWEELVSKGGYKFKRVSVDQINPGMLRQLFQKHSQIEELRIRGTALEEKDLDDIGRHLQKLKVLHTKVEKDGHQMVTFIRSLSKLRHLKMESDGESGIYGGYNWLNFSSEYHPLEVLELDNMAQSNPGLSWYNWFNHFPYLKTIKLKNCVLNHWDDFIAQISWLKKLDCLVLDGVSDRNGTFGNYQKNPNPNNIKVLKVRGDTMSSKELAALLEGCPSLEKVYLLNMDGTKHDVLEVLQRKGENSDGFLLNDNDIWSDATLEDIKDIIDSGKDVSKSFKL